ncbi:MAG TPA: adenylate/guanylate cyclase domain-containing protein [Stellaceae bacterium]|nr:adenylate/guanylate cyclase domain-containing protein [Stellaceae bacterium]
MPDNSRFCDTCGAALPVCCPSCGASNRAGARFCSKCGKALIQEGAIAPVKPTSTSIPTSSSAERRQLTVMFCDLVASTALSARLDPEDMREIIGAYHRCCAEQITKSGGFVAKYMGDGVLAYFGYPQAHEDDAERALRSGLTLIEAMPNLRTGHSVALEVRVGIATGVVVVGDLIGEGAAQEQGVVGETPNLAARLQTLAEPGQVVISQSTRRLAGGMFEYRDLGMVPLKGLADPTQAWRVLGASTAQSRFEAQHGAELTPLVGREEELELLLRRWRQAVSGEGRVVLLSGEPGIGKSRLTVALEERLQDELHTRLRYFCSAQHTDSAFHPVISQLERAAGFERHDAPETKFDKLSSLVASPAPYDEDVRLMAELLSIPVGATYAPLDLSPQRKKEKIFDALVRQLEMLTRQQPVFVVYEDVHWIDPSSRELLDRTVERVANLPVLLIITFRPEFQPPWIGQAYVSTLNLSRLGRREVAVLAKRVAEDQRIPHEIMTEIVERTDGVPLFVEELTKAVIEAGTRGAAAFTAIPHTTSSVPLTLHASLMARLDRLGPVAKDIAQKGAAIGRDFAYDLLLFIADLSEQDLQGALDRLTNSGLLFARGVAPQSTYIFKHALVRDAAYGTLLRRQRQELHARIAVALEIEFPEMAKSQPELLAHHFTEAGLAERAIENWLKAGQQALARSAMVEAEALLRKGLTVVSSLPDSSSRKEHELDLQIALGRALFQTQGFNTRTASEAYSRARQLCDELGRPHKLLPILYGQWVSHFVGADLTGARQFAAEMEHLGEARDDVATRVVGCRASGGTNLYLGDFLAARASLEEGLKLYDPAQQDLYAELTSVSTHVALLGYLMATLACSGYLDQARARCDEALAEAREVSHAPTLAHILWTAWQTGWCARYAPLTLLRYTDELLALSSGRELAFWHRTAILARGWSLAAVGRVEEGISLLTSVLSDIRATVIGPLALTILADAYRIAERPEVGLLYLAEAEQQANATKCGWFQCETLRMRGDLLMLAGDRAAAEASIVDAIALARRQGAKLWDLRASASLARLWRNQHKRSEARDLLAPIYGWFTEGFDTPDLKEAKALLEELA